MIRSILSDIHMALRAMRLQPKFALTVILTLALGTGATIAGFALVQAVLLAPLPFPESEQLVEIQTVSLKVNRNRYGCSLADGTDLVERSESIQALGIYREMRTNLIPKDRAIPARITLVTPGFFDALATVPFLGRTFELDEDQTGGDVYKAVLSHHAWQSLYGGDRSVVGRTIRTAMESFVVVGVMPPSFSFPSRTDLWAPIQSHLQTRQIDRTAPGYRSVRRSYRSVARLADGATVESAGAEVATVSASLQTEFPESNRDFEHLLLSLREAEAGELRPYLFLLLGAVLLVLLICGANIANLLLSKSVSRSRAIGMRAVLGASRVRMARQVLTESLVFATLGASLGLLFAKVGLSLFGASMDTLLPTWVRLEIDTPLLMVSAVLAVLGGTLVGLAPMVHAVRCDLAGAVCGGSRGSSAGGLVRPALVVAEVGLSMVLLVGAGLLLSSLDRLQRVDAGLDAERVLTVSMSAFRPGTNEERIRNVSAYYRRVIEQVEQLPGVVAAGGTDNFPYGSRWTTIRNDERFEVRGESQEEQAHRAKALLVDVTPDYFRAIGIPLLEGRSFTEGDDLDAPWVIILSQSGARTLFPDRPALGQEVRITYEGGGADPWARVVGIVGDVKYGKRDGQGIELYYPYTQYGVGSTTLAIRTRGPTQGLVGQLREVVHNVDPETAVEEIRPLAARIDDSLWRERLWGSLVSAFASLALLLAAIGIYGVVSYSVESRTREIGIRMALGSRPRDVLTLITSSGMRLVLFGLAIGLGLALAGLPLIRSLLFQAGGLDFLAYVVPALVLVGVSLIACLQPAFRGASIDPMLALRKE